MGEGDFARTNWPSFGSALSEEEGNALISGLTGLPPPQSPGQFHALIQLSRALPGGTLRANAEVDRAVVCAEGASRSSAKSSPCPNRISSAHPPPMDSIALRAQWRLLDEIKVGVSFPDCGTGSGRAAKLTTGGNPVSIGRTSPIGVSEWCIAQFLSTHLSTAPCPRLTRSQTRPPQTQSDDDTASCYTLIS